MVWANAQDILKLKSTIQDCLNPNTSNTNIYDMESCGNITHIIIKPHPNVNLKIIISLDNVKNYLIDIKINTYKVTDDVDDVLDSIVLTNNELGVTIAFDIQRICHDFLKSRTHICEVTTSHANVQASKLSELIRLF
jgi:hypothetical protein